jgi:hypothetical protein
MEIGVRQRREATATNAAGIGGLRPVRRSLGEGGR